MATDIQNDSPRDDWAADRRSDFRFYGLMIMTAIAAAAYYATHREAAPDRPAAAVSAQPTGAGAAPRP